MIHVLKCWPEPFEELRIGAKPFEVRRDDRRYAGGDVLRLLEVQPGGGPPYTGRGLDLQVTYCYRPHEAPSDFYRGSTGHVVVMAVRRLQEFIGTPTGAIAGRSHRSPRQ